MGSFPPLDLFWYKIVKRLHLNSGEREWNRWKYIIPHKTPHTHITKERKHGGSETISLKFK